jgi:signal peptidase I
LAAIGYAYPQKTPMETLNKPRKPWIAGLLSFFCFGLGQLYLGDPRRAILQFTGALIIVCFFYLCQLFYPLFGMSITIASLLFYVYFCIVDAVNVARGLEQNYTPKKENRWYYYLSFYLIGGFIVFPVVQSTAKKYVAQTYRVSSGSMRHTLQAGDYIVANKLLYIYSDPKRGDVVVFPSPKDPDRTYLNRVVGLGGETIEIRNKRVLIDSHFLDESYAIHLDERTRSGLQNSRDNLGPMTLPPDSLFVMGDNRDQSYDSRFYGFIQKKSIEGKASKIYWSWDEQAFRVRWNRIGKAID